MKLFEGRKLLGLVSNVGNMEIAKYAHDNAVKTAFFKIETFKYKQFEKSFESSLLIIDVLMFNSKKNAMQMLQYFELIDT